MLVDERYSSAEAAARMQHVSRKADVLARLDAESACVSPSPQVPFALSLHVLSCMKPKGTCAGVAPPLALCQCFRQEAIMVGKVQLPTHERFSAGREWPFSAVSFCTSIAEQASIPRKELRSHW